MAAGNEHVGEVVGWWRQLSEMDKAVLTGFVILVPLAILTVAVLVLASS